MSDLRSVTIGAGGGGTRRPAVCVIGWNNGGGLTVDAELILEALRARNVDAIWIEPRTYRGFRLVHFGRAWLKGRRRFSANIFLEDFDPYFFRFAALNLFIPNLEWFSDDRAPECPGIDAVLCKTADAAACFERIRPGVHRIGFTSRDRGDGSIAAGGPLRVLHVAGRSPLKGTAQVLAVWRRHPEWPPLTVVQRPWRTGQPLDQVSSSNVRILSGRLTDGELLELQRSHAVHVIPSEAEGFGHSIVEGMAVGALVVTTDGAPMNELVQADRGILVAAALAGRQSLGTLYRTKPEALEAAIERVVGLSSNERAGLGDRARSWFISNDLAFRQRFPALIANLASATG